MVVVGSTEVVVVVGSTEVVVVVGSTEVVVVVVFMVVVVVEPPPTVIVTLLCPDWPTGSVTVRVMVCSPSERSDNVNDGPVPISPSLSDVHTKAASARFGCCKSLSCPSKVIASPTANVSPFAGAVIVTIGLHPARNSGRTQQIKKDNFLIKYMVKVYNKSR
jgi:hypothetical protein